MRLSPYGPRNRMVAHETNKNTKFRRRNDGINQAFIEKRKREKREKRREMREEREREREERG